MADADREPKPARRTIRIAPHRWCVVRAYVDGDALAVYGPVDTEVEAKKLIVQLLETFGEPSTVLEPIPYYEIGTLL